MIRCEHCGTWKFDPPEPKMGPPAPIEITCARCRQQKRFISIGGPRKYCDECRPIARRLRGKAQSKVMKAVMRGDLPRASTLKCVDCGVQAVGYDHRSYDADKVLDVVPICKRCNILRGPANYSAETRA